MKKKSLFLILVLLAFFITLVGSVYHGKAVTEDATLFFVSHTEYWSLQDTGQTIVRLQDFQGNAIVANWCNVTIYYPNKTVYLNNQPMSPTAISGNYYINFTPPSVTGIYEEFVNCNYGVNKYVTTSESFHINPALNAIKDINTTQINQTVTQINQTVTSIFNDTQYIANNMVTSANFNDWKNNATGRFNNIDGNLTTLKGYCNTTETNSSALCQQIWAIVAFQQAQNTTYINYFSEINITTHNTYDFMTGTLWTKVNDTYNLLFYVNSTVTDIKENVTAIRQDQIDEVRINIIS